MAKIEVATTCPGSLQHHSFHLHVCSCPVDYKARNCTLQSFTPVIDGCPEGELRPYYPDYKLAVIEQVGSGHGCILAGCLLLQGSCETSASHGLLCDYHMDLQKGTGSVGETNNKS